MGVYWLVSGDNLWAKYGIVTSFDAEGNLRTVCHALGWVIFFEGAEYFKYLYIARCQLGRGNKLFGAAALADAVERVREGNELEGESRIVLR